MKRHRPVVGLFTLLLLQRISAPTLFLGIAALLSGVAVLILCYRLDSVVWIMAAVANACLAIPLFLLGCYATYILVGVFHIYVQVSDEGIEYRYWPNWWVRARWEDVDRLGEYRSFLGIRHDVLWLHRAEFPGRVKRPPWGADQPFIPLSTFRGWPKGALATDLRQRAPQLFEEGDAGCGTGAAGH